MDASLSFELLSGALGGEAGPAARAFSVGELPTPERLQDLLADAEIRLFLGREAVDTELIRTAWFLHGVASADEAIGRYEPRQQRQAFAVSAHVFDLASQDVGTDDQMRLEWAFGAQVGFHRSEAAPNASAIGRRVESWRIATDDDGSVSDRLPNLALRAGITLLSLDGYSTSQRLAKWNRDALTFSETLGVDDPSASVFGPSLLVVSACYDLFRYLREGRSFRLERAQASLERALSREHEGHDHAARWVASHLRPIGDAVAGGSVWSLLPSTVPDAAKQAFTMTSPQVLTLWPPQIALLAPDGDVSRTHEAKRIVASVPTSSGKTLISQLLMVTHIAVTGSGVCYVAPQRSLGREVRRGLIRRLRLLAKELARVGPDAGLPAHGDLADLLTSAGLNEGDVWSIADADTDTEPEVSVMTPERLDHALREDPDGVLARYGMFVFDEVHQVRERGRGFRMESVISYLHWRTRDTEHRIVLLSAVLGNAGQIRTWVDPGEQGTLVQSGWRGPRRLSVLFGTRTDRQAASTFEPVNARGSMAEYTRRRISPVFGTFRLKPTGRDEVGLQTTEPLGHVSYRVTSDGRSWPTAETTHSTAKYKMLAQIISFLGRAGSVLVVCDLRDSARDVAQAVASTLPHSEAAEALALTTRIKLGEDHPLAKALDHGVAYHHAGLPSDLLESIEDAVRTGTINYLVSTSTLTEGVNLPVRTVVLNPVFYPGQPADQKLSGPRLVNAIGRAGRAVLETEGWVVMTNYFGSSSAAFDSLEPADDELTTMSVLTRDDALTDLESFESALADGSDAALSAQGSVADFQAFVWFALAVGHGVPMSSGESGLVSLLDSTLAFRQLPTETRDAFLRVAELTRQMFEATDPAKRRTWARTGTSVNSARILDHLAELLATSVAAGEFPGDPGNAYDVVQALDQLGIWERILELPERPSEWKFGQTSHPHSDRVDVGVAEVLSQWLAGDSIPRIADGAFAGIRDRGWRLEKTVDTTSDFCEHYLAWLATVLITRSNDLLLQMGGPPVLASELGTYIRYGVSSHLAVELLTAGLRSRELANAIARQAERDGIERASVRGWLGALSFLDWRERFAATDLDLVDLIEYARPRGGGLLRELLLNDIATVDLSDSAAFSRDHSAVVLARRATGAPPYQIAVYEESRQALLLPAGGSAGLIAELPTRLHADAELLLQSGLDIVCSISGSRLIVRLTPD